MAASVSRWTVGVCALNDLLGARGYYASVTPRTLYRLTDESQLSAYRVGWVIRLQRHDIYERRVDLDDA